MIQVMSTLAPCLEGDALSASLSLLPHVISLCSSRFGAVRQVRGNSNLQTQIPNHKPQSLNQKLETTNPKPTTQNHKHHKLQTTNFEPETRNHKPGVKNFRPSRHKMRNLDDAPCAHAAQIPNT